MRQAVLSLAIIALALPFFAAAPAQAQSARTWVSGTGDNANPCSRTAPCRTFQGAMASTSPGGEINCLDAGDFGSVAIFMSLTISCEAGTAGILTTTSGAIAVDIAAATTDVVTLRGLDLDGQGPGGAGIRIFSARSVHVEKCTIRNFRSNSASAGIVTFANANTVLLFVADTLISDNSNGFEFSSSGGFKVASLKNVTITGSSLNGVVLNNSNIYVNVTESVISGNGGRAVTTGAGSTANVDRSTIANNAVALDAFGSGSIIRISGSNIYNNTTGFFIAPGAFIQTDATSNTGSSNGGATGPTAALTKN